jgi:linoleoyl-CoA desaturase
MMSFDSSTAGPGPAPQTAPIFASRAPKADPYKAFCQEIDAVKEKALARMGAEDVSYVKNLNRFSRAMEVAGRLLIHFSFEPISFVLGVVALWVHKQLQATEIGHTALHGVYDKLPGAERFGAKKFYWDTPIDEESWRHAHNVRHHGNTNVYGRDPDVYFGPVRLTETAPWTKQNRWQLPFAVGVLFPLFGFLINLHVTGLADAVTGDGRSFGILPDRTKESLRAAWKKALRKYAPYYLYNFVFFPALAGPMFWKVLLGNAIVEVMRDIYSAATIFCGHIGGDVDSYPEGTRAQGRGEWYAMQVRSTSNYEVSRPISVLCGGLDRQIEHHLFPMLPPPRLREVAPEVRAICERHGVPYKTDTWGATLGKALIHIKHLAREGGVAAVVREMS